jgi:hypothetical protein
MKLHYGVYLIDSELIHWFDSLAQARHFSNTCNLENRIKMEMR